MKLLYAMLCDNAFLSIDRKVNIIGVFETINAPSFPVQHPKFVLVGAIEPSKDNFKMAINIVEKKTGTSVINQNQERQMSLPKERQGKNFNFIIEILNTTFPASGDYEVQVAIDGKIIGSTSLTLAQVSEVTLN
jgi:hypothetical protein